MKKTDDKSKLLKACGKKVYHVTYERYLDQLFDQGLTNFWFGVDMNDCANMVELNHPEFKDEQQIVIIIPTALFSVEHCDFGCDSGDGWSDSWAGTGFYNGIVKMSDCKIYDLN